MRSRKVINYAFTNSTKTFILGPSRTDFRRDLSDCATGYSPVKVLFFMPVLVTMFKFYGHCNIGNVLNGNICCCCCCCCCLLHVSVWSNSHESEKNYGSCVSLSNVLFFLLIGKSTVSSVKRRKRLQCRSNFKIPPRVFRHTH